MIEKAMAIVSSCISRFSSTRGTSSPSTRITGWEPTLIWRSDARRSAAIFSRSLMCTGHLLWAWNVDSTALAGQKASEVRRHKAEVDCEAPRVGLKARARTQYRASCLLPSEQEQRGWLKAQGEETSAFCLLPSDLRGLLPSDLRSLLPSDFRSLFTVHSAAR